ncbi:hypothetical protein ACLPHM_01505 [Paenalcaligenes sp. Me131]|uniref:hypothetical protein n=1 Tax=Paenalcaligenes sp. Me131 TaxID=3392636 RepID=UPI003D2CA7A6
MSAKLWMSRTLAPIGLLALAACQTVPQKTDADAASTTAAPTTATAPAQQPAGAQDQNAQQMLSPVLVFLADTKPQEGWAEVQVGENSSLYLEPEAFLALEDFTGVEAGRSEAGEGLLALDMSEQAIANVTRVTSANPGKRLALVVDGTLLAVPGYSEPITSGRLVFMVGSEQNAVTAARIIAGDAAPAPTQAPARK